jgi:hypothetical protein
MKKILLTLALVIGLPVLALADLNVTNSSSIIWANNTTSAWGIALPAGIDHNTLANYSATRHFLETDINVSNMSVGTLPIARGGTGAANFVDLIALTTNTTGNYVASVATTAPLTGGAAGSEGAALTIVIPKATTSVDGYLNMTDWGTFNNKTTLAIVLALSNLTNYYNKTETVALTVLTNFYNKTDIAGFNYANTTNLTDHTGNTTVHLTAAERLNWNGVYANNHTVATVTDTPTFDFSLNGQAINGSVIPSALSLKNQTKSLVIYNITNTSDFLLWKFPKAVTITEIAGYCNGGTNITAVLQECNVTGQSCVDMNATIWTFVNGTELKVTAFTDAVYDAGDWIALNTSVVTGAPAYFSLTTKYDEN